jgi:hypothetical protein
VRRLAFAVHRSEKGGSAEGVIGIKPRVERSGALGPTKKSDQALRVRRNRCTRSTSIPNIAFVEFDLVTLQELAVFLLKTDLCVMIRLVADVADQFFDLRLAHRKATVSALPGKLFNAFRFNPPRGTAFEQFNDLRDVIRARETEKRMYMIRSATDD